MNSRSVFRIVLFIASVTAIAIAADSSPDYQKGTIKQDFSQQHKYYVVKNGDNGYEINHCGDFQTGQVVEYRVVDRNVYIRREDGKDYKCAIQASLSGLDASSATNPVPPELQYQKGTIEGFEIRRDVHIGGGGGGGGGAGTPGNPVSTWTRHAKVYSLRGPDLIYKVDYCGAFQAGKFTAGQSVEFRVVGDRIYIRHDNDQSYSCQLEGTLRPQDAPTEKPVNSEAAAPSAPVAVAATSTAKVSVASVPDGGDIEIDENFAGNTPSDLEMPEGDHVVTVKKSGYKNWERKIRVAAGSNVHLNAELEKTANP